MRGEIEMLDLDGRMGRVLRGNDRARKPAGRPTPDRGCWNRQARSFIACFLHASVRRVEIGVTDIVVAYIIRYNPFRI